MKNALLTCFVLLVSSSVFAQNSKNDTTEQELGWIFEVAPIFEDSDSHIDDVKLRHFIQKSIIYPQSAIDDSIEGKVFVNFIIDTSCNVQNAYIERGIRDDIDKEALRVINSIKYKSPAKFNRKPIPFHYTIPVNFILPKE
ncbi:MAG: TonB family protein [Salinivirgaceae bacterium]|jgi:protein TonB|nr:TonB family protein [Salinivirgaceae bacterium]